MKRIVQKQIFILFSLILFSFVLLTCGSSPQVSVQTRAGQTPTPPAPSDAPIGPISLNVVHSIVYNPPVDWGRLINPAKKVEGEETFADGTWAFFFEHPNSTMQDGSTELRFFIRGQDIKGYKGISIEMGTNNKVLLDKVQNFYMWLLSGDEIGGDHLCYDFSRSFSQARRETSVDPLQFGTLELDFADGIIIEGWSSTDQPNFKVSTIWLRLVNGINDDTDGRFYFRNFTLY